MKELRRHVKKWSVKNIIANVGATGMSFQANQTTGEEFAKVKQLSVAEIRRRINER